jgi:hypothetical protein
MISRRSEKDMMQVPREWFFEWRKPRLGICLLLTLCAAACDSVGGSSVLDGNRGNVTSPLGKTSGEPNGQFSDFIVAVFDEMGAAALQGSVSRDGDLDVFLIGALDAGDRVLIDASTAGSNLDVAVAVFDVEGRLMADNDDRTETNYDSRLDWIVRASGQSFYLVVTDSPFALANSRSGAYTIDILKESSGVAPLPQPQTLVLNFDGGRVEADILGGPLTLAPFDSEDIATIYRGSSETMKQAIAEVVAQNYERFNVTVLTSDDPPPAAGARYSILFFGGFNSGAFGIAEDVDLYNLNRCDDAVIYTESFSLDQFSNRPSVEQMAVAIGNVASHEAGHLLGLNHVRNPLDLMDDSSPADSFLLDQEFTESPLSADIMRIGTQDGVLLLNQSVGPAGE